MIHLPNRKRDASRRLAVILGHVESGIMTHQNAIAVGRIDPDIMCVAAPGDGLKCLSAVAGQVETAVRH